MIINARLDEQSEKDLQFIQEQTGETVTQIIKELLADRANKIRQKQQPRSKMKALLESDFVGCAEGPEDLSVNYKDYLYQGLKEKHGLDWYKPFQNLLLPDD
jgi:nucleoid-associated protein YejK